MRLTKDQVNIIIDVFSEYFLSEDQIWLFGSRVDDSKKGGDIDLYVETYYDNWAIAAEKQIHFLVDLKKRIGDQKIDLVLNLVTTKQKRPIYDKAKNTGIQIK